MLQNSTPSAIAVQRALQSAATLLNREPKTRWKPSRPTYSTQKNVTLFDAFYDSGAESIRSTFEPLPSFWLVKVLYYEDLANHRACFDDGFRYRPRPWNSGRTIPVAVVWQTYGAHSEHTVHAKKGDHRRTRRRDLFFQAQFAFVGFKRYSTINDNILLSPFLGSQTMVVHFRVFFLNDGVVSLTQKLSKKCQHRFD